MLKNEISVVVGVYSQREEHQRDRNNDLSSCECCFRYVGCPRPISEVSCFRPVHLVSAFVILVSYGPFTSRFIQLV